MRVRVCTTPAIPRASRQEPLTGTWWTCCGSFCSRCCTCCGDCNDALDIHAAATDLAAAGWCNRYRVMDARGWAGRAHDRNGYVVDRLRQSATRYPGLYGVAPRAAALAMSAGCLVAAHQLPLC